MVELKIAIVGVGNCASSLVQGIYYYAKPELQKQEHFPGILHKNIKGYSIEDIKIVAAFDIDKRKVGRDISEAIFASPNNTKIFQPEIPEMGAVVRRGPTLDGIPNHMIDYPEENSFRESNLPIEDVVSVLKEAKPDILINYLPVGSQKATEFYANCCLEAGVNFINAIPVFICSEDNYATKFKEKGLVCAGDDIKSQVGATIIHRVLSDLFEKRGMKVLRTYQLNTGGNTDFLNMLDRTRLNSKKISKTEAVQSQFKVHLDGYNIHVGPSDYVSWQKDNKVCFIRIEAEQFGGMPMNLELRLSVEDSPNSAGVMIDVIRGLKYAHEKGMIGYIDQVSAFGFKHPRIQYTDDEAIRRFEEFLQK